MGMNAIELVVMSPAAALEEFSSVWQKSEANQNVMPRLAFGSFRELFAAVTEQRLELLRYVAEHPDLDVTVLPRSLGRNKDAVSKDVEALVELCLLEKHDNGRLNAPYDEILIHAELRRAA